MLVCQHHIPWIPTASTSHQSNSKISFHPYHSQLDTSPQFAVLNSIDCYSASHLPSKISIMSPNYSFFAIPVFYILGMVPHAYANAQIVSARNGKYNNHNPRGQANLEDIKKTVPKETWQCFERSKAAHQNSIENLPLFAAAIICGNIARMGPDTLNGACGAFLGLRVAYLVAYIGITETRLSFARTAIWMSSVAVCFYVLISAGLVMMNGGPLPY